MLGVSTHTSRVSGRQAALERVGVGEIGGGVDDTRRAVDAVDEPERSPVGVEGQDQVVPGPEQRPQQGILGGQPAGEGVTRMRRLLQRGHLRLERRTGGIARAGVLVFLMLPDRSLAEGRGQVDGGDDRRR